MNKFKKNDTLWRGPQTAVYFEKFENYPPQAEKKFKLVPRLRYLTLGT